MINPVPVPPIIPYADVLAAAEAVGLKCVYPNGAAFAPASGDWAVAGFVTGDDATMRPAFRARTRRVEQDDLAGLVARTTFAVLAATEAWLAPVHHWAAELDHGTDDAGGTTADAFERIGVDVASLRGRRQADGVAFETSSHLERVLADLLPRLWKTDFTLVLPGVAAVATLHHHRQLWWRCADAGVADRLLQS